MPPFGKMFLRIDSRRRNVIVATLLSYCMHGILPSTDELDFFYPFTFFNTFIIVTCMIEYILITNRSLLFFEHGYFPRH